MLYTHTMYNAVITVGRWFGEKWISDMQESSVICGIICKIFWDTSGNFRHGIMSDWLAFCATENLDSLENYVFSTKVLGRIHFKENKLIKTV